MNTLIRAALIEARVIGVIETEQTEKNVDKMKNDRVIAAAVESKRYVPVTVKYLRNLIKEIPSFFVNYNATSNRKFNPIRNSGAEKAIQLIKKSMVE